jgi:hypothetical protein
MAQYESAEITLEQVCDQFGLSLPAAKRKAAAHDLPVPFYKKATKGGYYCSAQDWAHYLDAQKASARAEWQKMNNHATRQIVGA